MKRDCVALLPPAVKRLCPAPVRRKGSGETGMRRSVVYAEPCHFPKECKTPYHKARTTPTEAPRCSRTAYVEYRAMLYNSCVSQTPRSSVYEFHRPTSETRRVGTREEQRGGSRLGKGLPAAVEGGITRADMRQNEEIYAAQNVKLDQHHRRLDKPWPKRRADPCQRELAAPF